jgi:uncharacterized protein (TIGR03000 family)
VYSMVLMAALATGSAAPECHWCGGCWGGCHGCWGGCHGCWGGCHGCWGCQGCYGCYGWSHGACYGCYGCYGNCWGCWGGYSSWSCGCYSNGCCSGMFAPGYVVPAAPEAAPPQGEGLPKPKQTDKPMTMAPTRAKLIVEMPADARLYVDDRPMKTMAPVRTFSTPELEPGQVYYYELRAEVMRDGKAITQTKRVLLRAGDVVRARFEGGEAEPVATAQAR